jgi:hypothetical protein
MKSLTDLLTEHGSATILRARIVQLKMGPRLVAAMMISTIPVFIAQKHKPGLLAEKQVSLLFCK